MQTLNGSHPVRVESQQEVGAHENVGRYFLNKVPYSESPSEAECRQRRQIKPETVSKIEPTEKRTNHDQ